MGKKKIVKTGEGYVYNLSAQANLSNSNGPDDQVSVIPSRLGACPSFGLSIEYPFLTDHL